jgi:hypothetical protein
MAVTCLAALICGWVATAVWMKGAPQPTGLSQADVFGPPASGAHQGPASPRPTASPSAGASQQPKIVRITVADRPGQHRGSGQAGPGYLNPLRAVSGLVPERIDEGVDFGGTGPVYALGDAVITNASESSGWPGGGWITYQLTDGPAAGLMVYVAEDVTPAVTVGQHVSSSTVIANMFAGADGIETGWAQPTGVSAESELPEAGGIGASGPYPTRVGVDFDALLQALGVPAAPTPFEPAYGILPANYPASW